MILPVYHGSYTKIIAVDLSKGQDNRDFGRGFYVTKFRHHAENWAKIIGSKRGTDGFITDIFYTSNTFSLFADETTELHKKTWQEIYKHLKND